MATVMREMMASGVPYCWPSAEAMEDILRKTRRSMSEARHAAEDFAAEAGLEVRRHPLAAVGLATGAGIVAGVVVGFAAAWYVRGRG